MCLSDVYCVGRRSLVYCGRCSPSISLSCLLPLSPSTDLVWSDPEEIAGWAISPRGAGYLFGASVTQEVRVCVHVCVYVCNDLLIIRQTYQVQVSSGLVTV